jgi:1-acyl-sn-glycerol-3-phosphate acyltransferase
LLSTPSHKGGRIVIKVSRPYANASRLCGQAARPLFALSHRMLSKEAATILAYGVLGLMALALAAWAIAAKKRTRYSWRQSPIYLYSTLMSRVLWRTRISGRLPVSNGQGAVIVSNHVAGIDPSVIAVTTNRPVRWMVAREYCTHWALGPFFRTLGCIPVNRGGIDTAATKLAIRYAQAGDLVGLFPEGRINNTGALLLPGRPGAALIALKARVPVIPCFVRGTPYAGDSVYSSLFMTAKASVTVGQPIDISPYVAREREDGILEELTKRFLVEIARLAGVEDYEPQLAGRKWKTGS